MKRKFFLGTAALVLAAVGVFAGRASKKLTTIATLYYKIGVGGTCTEFIKVSSNTALRTAGFGATAAQATLVTANSAGLTAAIFYTSSCGAGQAVYFQP